MESIHILVKHAPIAFMKKKLIKGHFGKYGSITNVVMSEKHNACCVTFSTAAQAKDAKTNGIIWNNKELDISLIDSPTEYDLIDDELNWFVEQPVQEPKDKLRKSLPKVFSFEMKNELKNIVTGEVKKSRIEEEELHQEVNMRAENEMTGKVAVSNNDITSKVAFSNNDRLNILEDRDKLIRVKMDKVSSLKSAVRSKGTCPDMCPEKERVMREARGMVAPYEMSLDGNFDPNLAVKEYTRSSADQEEPLPHELRPEPVLTMTMEYLIIYIMCKIEQEDENLANWFDFCWGRLRAIRKDIIQQQLCDLNTVAIVEQCARFHIICFDRLWGSPKSIFDEKINSETLMNCLQSLMHMYEDLKKQNVTCPNEAEFKAYLILLKLNSGYLLSEYQQYSDEIQNSPELRDAVNIHTAYSNNMYSSFFKLLRQTSYLNACLMQRFFGHLRSKALHTIVKAYCPPNLKVHLPLDFLEECLKFDLSYDCVAFCESFGLRLSSDDAAFIVARNHFGFPDTLHMVNTPSSLVIQKREVVHEAVYGSAILPDYLAHQVHSSFTSENTLSVGSLDASDQEEKMLRDVVERKLVRKRGCSLTTNSSEINIKPQAFMNKPQFVDNLFEGNEESDTEDKTTEETLVRTDVIEPAELYTDNKEHDSDSEEESEANSSVSSEKWSEASYRSNASDHESYLAISSSSNTPTQVPTPFFSFKLPSPKSEMKQLNFPPLIIKPNSPLMAQKESSPLFKKPLPSPDIPSSRKLSQMLFQKSPSPPSPLRLPTKSTKQDAPKILHREKHDRVDQLVLSKLRKSLSERMKKINARKYAKLWKEKVDKIHKLRENMRGAIFHLSVKEYLNIWGNVSSDCNTRTCDRLNKRKQTSLLVKAILDANVIDQLDGKTNKVSGLISDILGKNSVVHAHKYGNISQPYPIYWKLVFALPEQIPSGSTFPTKLRNWCKAAFYPDSIMNLGDVHFKMSSSCVPVFTSTQVVEGIQNINNVCKNISSLILVRAQGWETCQQTLSRLDKILNCASSQIPVAVLTLGAKSDVINLPIKNKNITHLQQGHWGCTESLVNSLGLLAKHTYIYNIKVQSLALLIDIITERFFDSLHEDMFVNEGLYVLLTNPNNAIDFYNQLIDKVEQEIEECCLFNLYGTACEFKPHIIKHIKGYDLFPEHYNEPNFKIILSNHMTSLKLKHLKWNFKSSLDLLTAFQDYCDDLKCNQIVSKLMRLINPPDDDSGLDLTKYLEGISWLPIVEILSKQTLNKELYDFKVVFRNDKINNEFIDTHWWMNCDIVLKANQDMPST